MAETVKQEYGFELVGGRLCLDFVNTLNGSRETGETEEKLLTYADLISWSRQAGVIASREARSLLREAARRPEAASEVVACAVALREAIYGIFYSTAHERTPSKKDMSVLNSALSEAMTHSEIVRTPEGFQWHLRSSGDDKALDRVLWPVARSAAELLTSTDVGRARVCEASDCTWLFMDVSKNRSRRWCDMKYCGNRAKSRRHYERKRATMSR
jgi:predicted RNA-binding Zn ribbon-like protein